MVGLGLIVLFFKRSYLFYGPLSRLRNFVIFLMRCITAFSYISHWFNIGERQALILHGWPTLWNLKPPQIMAIVSWNRWAIAMVPWSITKFTRKTMRQGQSNVVTPSDSVPVTSSSSDSSFANVDQATKPKPVAFLPASFYERFLSTKSKERRPSPSEHPVLDLHTYLVSKDISSQLDATRNETRSD